MFRLIGLAVVAGLLTMGSVVGAALLSGRAEPREEATAEAGTELAEEGTLDPPSDGSPDLVGSPSAMAERDTASASDSIASEPIVVAAADSGSAESPSSNLTTAVPDPEPPVAQGAADAPREVVPPRLAEGRLGKIFGSMQPKEAARVLEQMGDSDVVTILAMLNDRQAAAVLANLPPQRAAQISRLGVQAERRER